MHWSLVWVHALVLGVVSALVTTALVPSVIVLALRVRAVDVPGGRRRQPGRTPRLGGLAIVGGIVASLTVGTMLSAGPMIVGLARDDVVTLLGSALLIFLVGVADDVVGLGPFVKLILQGVAASVVVAAGWQFTALRLPIEGRFYVGILGPALSVVWIVGVTNAINFIDGLDGLAAGIVAIIASSLLLLAVFQHSSAVVVVMSAIAGSSFAFLRHNWRPARIYMGDCGSLTLGFLLAVVSLRSTPSVKASAAVAILVPILALGLPVFDMLFVMLYRFLRESRLLTRIVRMFYADRSHLHYLLVDDPVGRRIAIPVLYGLTAGFSVMALVVASSGSWALGLAFLAVEFSVVLLVRHAGLRPRTGRSVGHFPDIPRVEARSAGVSFAEERLIDAGGRIATEISAVVPTEGRGSPGP